MLACPGTSLITNRCVLRSVVLKVAFLAEVDDVFSTQEPRQRDTKKVKREPVLLDFLLYPHLTCSN